MERENLTDLKKRNIAAGINNWSTYFNKKLNKDLAKMYGVILLPYSLKTIDVALEQVLEQFDRFPSFGQLKTLVSSLENVPTAYNKKSDPAYPVAKMHTALGILIDRGEQAFVEYVNKTGMPRDDEDRVRTKAGTIMNQGGHGGTNTPGHTVGNRVGNGGNTVGNTRGTSVANPKELLDKVGIDVSEHERDNRDKDPLFS